MNRYFASLAVISACMAVSACSSSDSSSALTVTNCDPDLSSKDVVYTLKPEWTPSPSPTVGTSVDVNLGNSPESFVQAAYEQIYGATPSAGIISTQAANLRNLSYWRRIDVVHTFFDSSGTTLSQVFSDPWVSHPDFTTAPCKALKRDVGAVLMYFFGCNTSGTNCNMNWANTHAHGMNAAHALYGFGASSTGDYNSATNAGFFYRELMDARHAGLQFLLANTYGPDLTDGSMTNLASALAKIHADGVDNTVKMALLDDTWGWGNLGGVFATPPDLHTFSPTATSTAATKIYQNKWKKFFNAIPRQDWYTVNGRPLVFFYNAGTLQPSQNAASVIAAIKELFNADFGVEPWVVVDKGFNGGNVSTADSMFTWDTRNLSGGKSRSTMNGITVDHAIVKWDPIGRDTFQTPSSYNVRVAGSADNLKKGGEFLQSILDGSEDADILVLGTWNDLGEGTGINRNYDYYYQGSWLAPNYFMNKVRHSQAHSPDTN